MNGALSQERADAGALVRRDAAFARPVAQPLHLLGHDHRQRTGLGEGGADAFGGELRTVGVGVVERADDGLFDFGPGKPVAGRRQFSQIEAPDLLLAAREVDAEGVAACGIVRILRRPLRPRIVAPGGAA